jgi:hypothetical protein
MDETVTSQFTVFADLVDIGLLDVDVRYFLAEVRD